MGEIYHLLVVCVFVHGWTKREIWEGDIYMDLMN